MPTISYVPRSSAAAATRAVYEEIMRTYGLDEPRGIYLLMGHTPAHLAGSWPRSRHCYGRDSALTMKQKHLLTLAISAANNCEYCVRSHTVRLRQLRATDTELVELLAELGFEPEPPDGPRTREIRLRHCPFQNLAEQHGDVICSVHLGLMQGALTAMRAPVAVDRLDPFVEPDLCVAHLAPAPTRERESS